MELTAILMSAVSSITAGTLPGPTPTAGLPEEYAALTIPGPPVARIKSASRITRLVKSGLGSLIQQITFRGAPACTAASRITRAAAIVLSLARGCGEKIIALRVFSANNALKIAVEVGFVVGITAATKPTGSAIFLKP